jgi:hypothetical protein
MHEEKKEVYIVTHVDEAAWPDGTGGIRYGFNQKVRKQYPDREAFLAAYLEAVSQYRQVRLEVDQLAGKGASRDRYLELLAHLPADLAKREAALREEMYAFTAMQTLKVGDVIAVDTLVPHSLQHGVRVVEFQTPHYERYILSFGQQVLTQEHWDTATAISRAVVDAPSSMDPEEVCPGQELIADFDAFRVYRLELDPGQHISIDQPAYSIVIGIYGSTSLRYGDVEVTVGAEAAYLVPASPSPTTYASSGGEPACLLVAEEKTGSAR